MTALLTKRPAPPKPKRDGVSVPRSQTERLWLIGGGLVAFVLLLIGYFFFISPQRSQTSDVNSQVTSTQQQNATLKTRLDALREQSKNLAKYQADLAKARLALPSTSGVTDFVRSLQALGGATQTNVTSLSVGQPAPVQAAVAAVAAAPTPTASASSSGSTAAPAAAAPAAPAAYSMSITASVSGSVAGLDKFLDQLQAVQPRAVLVTQVSESSAATGAQGGTTTLQLSMQAFVVPEAAAAPAAGASPTASN